MQFGRQKDKKEETPTKLALFQLSIKLRCRDWDVGSGGACPHLGAVGWGEKRCFSPVARHAVAGEEVEKNEVEGPPHHT